MHNGGVVSHNERIDLRLLPCEGISAAFCDTVVGLPCFWAVQGRRDQKKQRLKRIGMKEFP
jgi:hypothetical protein